MIISAGRSKAEEPVPTRYKDQVEIQIYLLGNDSDVYSRRQAAETLGKWKDVRSIQPLLDAVQNDVDKDVREAAVRALPVEQLADSDLEILGNQLKHETYWVVREKISDVLGKSANPIRVNLMLEGVQSLLYERKDLGTGIDRAIDDSVITMINYLGDSKDPRVLPLLLKAFFYHDEESAFYEKKVRKAAALALGKTEERAAEEVLVEGMKSRSNRDLDMKPEIFIRALRPMRTASVVAALLSQLQMEAETAKDMNILSVLIESLMGKTESSKIAAPLISRLKLEEDSKMICMLADLLGMVGDPSAVQPLVRKLKGTGAGLDTDSYSFHITTSLIHIGDDKALHYLRGIMRLGANSQTVQFTANYLLLQDHKDPELRQLAVETAIKTYRENLFKKDLLVKCYSSNNRDMLKVCYSWDYQDYNILLKAIKIASENTNNDNPDLKQWATDFMAYEAAESYLYKLYVESENEDLSIKARKNIEEEIVSEKFHQAAELYMTSKRDKITSYGNFLGLWISKRLAGEPLPIPYYGHSGPP
ncbi:MAG: HEAT repeat domain-containing protein [Deltaproteobacteria bacterium]|nr:HEAT repeat domain-containing protein [Deltaproteobacteria bacterium]